LQEAQEEAEAAAKAEAIAKAEANPTTDVFGVPVPSEKSSPPELPKNPFDS
jgi:hypothetical protein